MPNNSVKHGTNADVFGEVDGQHVRTESNMAGQPLNSGCYQKTRTIPMKKWDTESNIYIEIMNHVRFLCIHLYIQKKNVSLLQ